MKINFTEFYNQIYPVADLYPYTLPIMLLLWILITKIHFSIFVLAHMSSHLFKIIALVVIAHNTALFSLSPASFMSTYKHADMYANKKNSAFTSVSSPSPLYRKLSVFFRFTYLFLSPESQPMMFLLLTFHQSRS